MGSFLNRSLRRNRISRVFLLLFIAIIYRFFTTSFITYKVQFVNDLPDTMPLKWSKDVLGPKRFNFTLQPSHKPCSKGSFPLVIYVRSNHNPKDRALLRETVGREAYLLGIPFIFVVGIPQPSIQEKLLVEHRKFKDILQADFNDSYNNLTIKGWSILYWHEKVCGKKENYQFWSTIDNFLMVDNLVALLKAKRNFWNKLPAIIGECHLIKDDPILHHSNLKSQKNKYFLSAKVWPYDNSLPVHCSGAGVLISPAAARRILARTSQMELDYLIEFWQDDVLLFGLFATQSHVKLVDNEYFSTARADNTHCFDTCHKMVSYHSEKFRNNRESFRKEWKLRKSDRSPLIFFSGPLYGNIQQQNINNLIIYVHSAPGELFLRDWIRDVWGREARRFEMAVFFVVGHSGDEETQEALEREKHGYEDIILAPFVDQYILVAEKLQRALKWHIKWTKEKPFFLWAPSDSRIFPKKLLLETAQMDNSADMCMQEGKHPILLLNYKKVEVLAQGKSAVLSSDVKKCTEKLGKLTNVLFGQFLTEKLTGYNSNLRWEMIFKLNTRFQRE